jgi:hypothetical protein
MKMCGEAEMQDGPLSAIVPGGKLLPGLHEGRSRWYAWWIAASGIEGLWGFWNEEGVFIFR